MKISRRQLLGAAATAPLLGLADAVRAQAFQKPIVLMVPVSPGTVLDVTARFLAGPLTQLLKTPVVVENRVGANGIIGTDYVAKSAPDGTTLLMAAVGHYINKFITDTPLPYDPEKDFTPVARLVRGAMFILVGEKSPYKTLADLVRDMKARPGEVTFASAGTGSTTHLYVLLLNQMTDTVARHIPYKGAAGAVTDTVSGQVAFTCQSVTTAMALVKSGKLRALAQTGAQRLDEFSDVPTVAQAGVPGYEAGSWIGVLAPGATPAPVVDQLSRVIMSIGGTPAFKAFCANQLFTPDLGDARRFGTELTKEVDRYRRVVETAKSNGSLT